MNKFSPKLTQEEIIDICKLFATGEYSKAELSRKFEVSAKTIEKHVKNRNEFGVYKNPKQIQLKKLNEFDKKKLIESHLSGEYNYKELAKQYQVSPSGVKKYLASLNLTTPRRYPISQEERKEMLNLYLTGKYTYKQIGEMFSKSGALVRNTLLAKGVESRPLWEVKRNHTVTDNYFESINTEEKAYWLGWMYSDGTHNGSRIKIALQAQDKPLLYRFKQALSCTKELASFKTNFNTFSCELTITSRKMCEDLTRLGCVPRKSLILKFPTEDQVPKHLLKYFIRGYFEGDGTVSKSSPDNPYFQLLGTEEFLSEAQKYLVDECGLGFPKIHKKYKDGKFSVGCLRYGGWKQFIRIMAWLYSDDKYVLERKYNKYLEILSTRKRS
jgi:DNA-binding CsgD family transcriptional regulator